MMNLFISTLESETMVCKLEVLLDENDNGTLCVKHKAKTQSWDDAVKFTVDGVTTVTLTSFARWVEEVIGLDVLTAFGKLLRENHVVVNRLQGGRRYH